MKDPKTEALKQYGLEKSAIVNLLFKDWGSAAESLKNALNNPNANPHHLKALQWLNKPGALPAAARVGRGILNMGRMLYLGNPVDYVHGIKNALPTNYGAKDVVKAIGTTTLKDVTHPISLAFLGLGAYNVLKGPEETRAAEMGRLLGKSIIGSPFNNLGLPGEYVSKQVGNLGAHIGKNLAYNPTDKSNQSGVSNG